jgi:hypothetical protein
MRCLSGAARWAALLPPMRGQLRQKLAPQRRLDQRPSRVGDEKDAANDAPQTVTLSAPVLWGRERKERTTAMMTDASVVEWAAGWLREDTLDDPTFRQRFLDALASELKGRREHLSAAVQVIEGFKPLAQAVGFSSRRVPARSARGISWHRRHGRRRQCGRKNSASLGTVLIWRGCVKAEARCSP